MKTLTLILAGCLSLLLASRSDAQCIQTTGLGGRVVTVQSGFAPSFLFVPSSVSSTIVQQQLDSTQLMQQQLSSSFAQQSLFVQQPLLIQQSLQPLIVQQPLFGFGSGHFRQRVRTVQRRNGNVRQRSAGRRR